MIRLLLFFVWCLFLAFSAQAQARLGYTEAQVKEAFSDETFETGYLKNSDGTSTRYIHFENSAFYSAYYFGGNGNTVTTCIVMPTSPTLLSGYIERYNREYVIVSDSEWKFYSSEGVMYIQLDFIKLESGRSAGLFIYSSK